MPYTQFKQKMYEIKQLNSVSALLSWDMEVMMPHASDRGFRADQSSLINGITHEKMTSKELEDIILQAKQNPQLSEREKRELDVAYRNITKRKKLSKDFVEKESKLTSEAYSIWEKAKTASDFKLFELSLNRIVEMLREKCELLGYESHPYNALLDSYEEGMTVSTLDPLFSDVEKRLKVLIDRLLSIQKTRTNILTQEFDIASQQRLVSDIMNLLQVPKDLYRLDISSHPFCTNFHASDIRMTTRYNVNDLMSSIWSAIHESGHARYEMGVTNGHAGLPSTDSVSLGIHESQSRFWENNIGRSRAFIELIFPLIAKHFPQQMKGVDLDDLFHEINYVTPSLIRTESDELTYHYHIMIRYEIEKKLISGELKSSDVQAYWNELYKKYLGLIVEEDSNGSLQDVHWSFGGLGYFPTYSLGSFFAAQWYCEINQSENIADMIRRQEFEKINQWHYEHIHQHGALYTSNELCQMATGKALDFACFESYISQKFNFQSSVNI